MTNDRTESATRPVAALLTPRGRGAVATVRVVGDCRLLDTVDPPPFRAANGKPLSEQPINRIVFGEWGTDVCEQVVLCRTGEQTIEIHCHGGEAAARTILSSLESVGCRIATWKRLAEETNGKFEVECLEALARAATSRTAEFLLEQHRGVLRPEIEAIHQFLCPVPVKRGVPSGFSLTPDSRRAALSRLDGLLRWGSFGLHLSCPWTVVLGGRSNVGKSSLVNALLGYSRSIVFDQPGTTRDVVTAETALQGWPIRFSDTAGIRQHADDLERAGIERAHRTLAEADCRILLFDTSRPPHVDDWQLMVEWPDAIRIAHKFDLPNVWGDATPADAVCVSSVTREGVDVLAEVLIAKLVPEVPEPGTPIPITHRQIDLLTCARDELGEGNDAECVAALEQCMA
jgi:tRNA modification GTPase